jgi:hypothetical protein
MECTPFERGKVLKENCNERSNILGCFLGGALWTKLRNVGKEAHEDITYNSLAILGVREANTNRLVNKKYIGVAVPRFFEERWVIGCIGNPAGP